MASEKHAAAHNSRSEKSGRSSSVQLGKGGIEPVAARTGQSADLVTSAEDDRASATAHEDDDMPVPSDIDALKRAERLIADARDYSEAIIRTVPDPLVVLHGDLRVQRANEAFYRVFELSPAQTEGQSIFELDHGSWNIPELRQLLEDIIPGNSFFNDFEVTHKFERIGRRTMLLNARALLQAEGNAKLVLLGIRDITDVLQFQVAERQIQARYEALVQASVEIVWTTAPSGAIVENSPSWRAFTGETYDEWKGVGWLDAIHPDDRERVSEWWQRAVAARTVVETEYRLRHVGGDWRWMAVRAVPVFDTSGSVREWVGMKIDITARKQAEEILRKNHAQLRSQAEELARFNNVAVGRELRMIELKKEINELCREQGQPARYPLEFEQETEDSHDQEGSRQPPSGADD
jgi:PAS domain S-box-containing protein